LFCNQVMPQHTVNWHCFLYMLDWKWAGLIGQNQREFLTSTKSSTTSSREEHKSQS
jgi:hypothetical protein